MINLTPLAILFTLAAIGISETAYLIRKRVAAERPVCPMGEGCATVLNSKYNKLILGIHNDIFGMIFYIALAAISAFLVIGFGDSDLFILLAKLIIVGGTAMSFILIYIQWRIIKAWCFWCLMSAATIGLMALIILTFKLI